MSSSPQKLILTIQDISCVGQCSLTCAMPIISACGIETAILPSAVLSTHTGGFKGFTFRDLTEDMPKISDHWSKEHIAFDAFYTGYLGSIKQIDYVIDILNKNKKENSLKIIDPAMADLGKLYVGFDQAFVTKMKDLCSIADILLPNITEAAFLTGLPYKSEYDHQYITSLINGLVKLGAKTIVLTGVSFNKEKLGVMVYENGEEKYYEHQKIDKLIHGTGDVYASAFVGALLNGKSIFESASIAADYVVQCILQTMKVDNHWYGVTFEKVIPYLLKRIGII